MSRQNPDIDEVLAALSLFDRAQLDKIESKLRFLKSDVGAVTGRVTSTTSNVIEVSVDDELLLSAISDFLSSQGLEQRSRAALKRSPNFKAFKEKVPAIVHYFTNAAGKLTRLERIKMYNEAVRLLYLNLVAMNVTVSARTLLSHVHRIPSVMNQAFPLYAQNGVLYLVVRKRIEQHEPL